MNTLIIIILVAVVALQFIQLKKITKLTHELEALRDERNINTEVEAEAVEPIAEERTVAMNIVEPTAVVAEKIEEPTPAVEEVTEVVAEPEKEEPITEAVAEPVAEEPKPAEKPKAKKAKKAKKERKEISSEDILYWTILGVIAALSIFFAIAL